VSAAKLIDALEYHLRRYLAIDDGLPLVLAVWSLATHLFDCFDAYPYLGVTSPTKRCGKSRVGELLELFCARPCRTVGISVAALFRTIDKDKPTMVIDEAEGLRGGDERSNALKEILNAGYRKGQKVRRCEGGNGKSYAVREFETYCPKVIVLIGSLPDTLADRTIPVQMRRRRPQEKVDRLLLARAKQETAIVRKNCGQWATKHRERVQKVYARMEDLPFLEDREAELWLPLFAVCTIAAPHRLPELETVARKLAGIKAADEPTDLGIKLLGDVREVFQQKGTDRSATSDLLAELNQMAEAPWPTYWHGRELNARGLGRLLHPFGIQPQNMRTQSSVLKGYLRDSFKDAWERYLPAVSATPLQGP